MFPSGFILLNFIGIETLGLRRVLSIVKSPEHWVFTGSVYKVTHFATTEDCFDYENIANIYHNHLYCFLKA